MEVLDDVNTTFADRLQRLVLLMSEDVDELDLDGRTLLQCDEELGAMGLVQKQLERRVALVRRKRNTFTPINALPPELLVIVFAAAIDFVSGMVSSDHATLMLVCDYWNHLVNNSPSLWTKIRKTGGTSDRSIIRALEKSKGAPLEITCISWGMEQADQNAFLSAIFPHAHHWRDVSLWLSGENQELDAMAGLSAPFLEYLCLSIDEYPGWVRGQPLDLFGGRPSPRLRWLVLNGIPVPWTPTTLCDLKVLSIAQMQRLGPSLDQLLAVLSACPRLESLTIRDVNFEGGAHALSLNAIHMPTLDTLELQGIAPEITNQLLAFIHAPVCKFGTLSGYAHGDPLETLFSSDVSHFFDHMRSGANAGSIRCSSDGIRITWTGSWYINLIVENIKFAKATLNWLSLSPAPNPPVVPLHMTIYVRDPPLVEEILAVMTDMEALHRVTFGHETPVAGALRFLATGGLVGGRASEPFPALEEIRIDNVINDDDWEYVSGMLRRRQGEMEVRNGLKQLKPIRRLRLGDSWYVGDDEGAIAEFGLIHWPNRLEEVRRLLGPEGELVWYGRVVTQEGVLADPIPQEWDD